jgi:hypothetical protein
MLVLADCHNPMCVYLKTLRTSLASDMEGVDAFSPIRVQVLMLAISETLQHSSMNKI